MTGFWPPSRCEGTAWEEEEEEEEGRHRADIVAPSPAESQAERLAAFFRFRAAIIQFHKGYSHSVVNEQLFLERFFFKSWKPTLFIIHVLHLMSIKDIVEYLQSE